MKFLSFNLNFIYQKTPKTFIFDSFSYKFIKSKNLKP